MQTKKKIAVHRVIATHPAFAEPVTLAAFAGAESMRERFRDLASGDPGDISRDDLLVLAGVAHHALAVPAKADQYFPLADGELETRRLLNLSAVAHIDGAVRALPEDTVYRFETVYFGE